MSGREFSLILLLFGIVMMFTWIGTGVYLMGGIESVPADGGEFVKVSDLRVIVVLMWVGLGVGIAAGIAIFEGVSGLLRR